MADWQLTVQAVAAAVAVLLLGGTLIAALRQFSLVRTEQASRVRPWLQLTGIHLIRRGRSNSTDEKDFPVVPDSDQQRVYLLFNNVGALPAADTRLDVRVYKSSEQEWEEVPEQSILNMDIGTVFPNEASERIISGKHLSKLDLLIGKYVKSGSQVIAKGKPFKMEGQFRYVLGETRYSTDFEAEFDPDRDVFKSWKNVQAT